MGIKMLNLKIQDKRIFLKYINIFFIIAVFLLHITSSLLNPKVENDNNIIYENEYNYYLNTLEGELTSEKEQFIISESKNISSAKIELQKAYNDYYDGEISKEEIDEISYKCNSILATERGFKATYEQYLFVREQAENRYFLNTNAFSSLFNSCENVFFIFIYIILITVPMFCKEYESNMAKLLVTYQNGGKFLARRKIFFTVSCVSLFFIIDVVLRYTFFTILYGSVGSNYPLQSVQLFANSTLDITILQGYIIVCLTRLLGSILFTLFLLFISLFLKQSVSVALAGLIIAFVPLFLTVPTERYIYVAPISLIIGTGYLMGDIVTTNIVTGEEQILFLQPSGQELSVWFVSVVFCVLMMYFTILHLNTNLFNIKKRSKIKFATFLVLAILFSGCSTKETENVICYNSITSKYVQDETFVYYSDDDGTLIGENKKDGEKQKISPVFSYDIDVLNYYSDGRYLYYSYIQTQQTSLNNMLKETIFRIISYDSLNSEEIVVYEKTDEQRKLINDSQDFPIENQPFFLTNEYLFFYANNIILQMDRFTFEFKELDINSSIFAFDGDFIYYIDDNLVICKHDIAISENIKLENVVATSFYLTDENIIFINRADDYKLYKSDKNGESVELLIDDSMSYFYFDENTIVVMSTNDTPYPLDDIVLKNEKNNIYLLE